jgi:hypothetical protein
MGAKDSHGVWDHFAGIFEKCEIPDLGAFRIFDIETLVIW